MKRVIWMYLMLVLASVMTGGNALMAVAVGEGGSDTDPNNGKPLDNGIVDDPGKGISQGGQGATGSAADDAGIVENQINDYVSKFQAYDYPLHTDFLREARQIQVDTKEPNDYQIGEAVMEAFTKSALTNSGYDPIVSLPLYKNDVSIFPECATVLVENGGAAAVGYDEQGNADGSPLVLYVESNTKNSGITVSAINGPLHDGAMYVPAISAGAKLYVMAPALSESEVEVAPDAAYPQPQKVYLQKKVCAITYTELFERIKKKANWNVQDIKDWQLAMFRKKCTRTLLISAPSKRLRQGSKNTGVEYCYTQNGVLRQIRLGYQISGRMTIEDLIGMQRMVFSKYNNGVKEVDVYCGTKALLNLHNIDFKNHPEVQFKREEMGETKITVSSFESTFGKFNFKKEQGLDDIGKSEYMVLFAMAKAKRFYYENGKQITIDHSKGEGGEVREAKSEYFIQDDCLQLTDMNSMIVGPDLTMTGYTYGVLKAVVKSVGELPVSATANDIVYLTVADSTHAIGLWRYDGTAWVAYAGEIDV